MPARSRLMLPAAVALVMVLSGCVIFGPIFGLPPAVEQQPQLVIENTTDQDWVVRAMVDGFAQDIGVPNGGSGTALLSEGALTSLVLLSPDCQEVGELEWSETLAGVRIEGDGLLTAVEQPMVAGDEVFPDFSECTTGFGPAPSSLGSAVGAPGTIHFLAGEGRGWLIDPATADITSQAADTGRTNDGEHAISPDGSSVVFTRYSGNLDSSDVYVADLANGSERLLVEDASEPVWSPVGTQVGFISFDPFTAGPTINVIAVAGGDPLELAEGTSTPRWSPDGTMVAFIYMDTDAELDPAPKELRIVNVDGTGLASLADAHPFADEPSWSPDGSRIAFSAGSKELGRIEAVDVATGAITTLAEIGGSDLSSPAWAPDGKSVAFAISTQLETGPEACVAVVTLTGKLTKYGVVGDTSYASPTWSPDATWLAAVRTWQTSESSDLLVMDLATTDGTVIATGALAITSWRD